MQTYVHNRLTQTFVYKQGIGAARMLQVAAALLATITTSSSPQVLQPNVSAAAAVPDSTRSHSPTGQAGGGYSPKVNYPAYTNADVLVQYCNRLMQTTYVRVQSANADFRVQSITFWKTK